MVSGRSQTSASSRSLIKNTYAVSHKCLFLVATKTRPYPPHKQLNCLHPHHQHLPEHRLKQPDSSQEGQPSPSPPPHHPQTPPEHLALAVIAPQVHLHAQNTSSCSQADDSMKPPEQPVSLQSQHISSRKQSSGFILTHQRAQGPQPALHSFGYLLPFL